MLNIISPSVQFSCIRLFAILQAAAHLSITNFRSLCKLMSTELVIQSNHFILCNPLLLLPQSFPASGSFPMNQLFTSGGQVFSFSISPSSEHSGLISFKTDWFHLLVVQRTLKSLLQQHIWKASILQCSAFFMDQLSHLYITTGKTIPLTIQALSAK